MRRSVRFAGFLPFARTPEGWHVLLGLERDGWGPFGGGPEPKDAGSHAATAVREAWEESCGVFLQQDLREAARQDPLWHDAGAKIFGLLVPPSTDELLNSVFAANLGRAAQPPADYREKCRAAWLPLADLLSTRPLPLPLRGPAGTFRRCLRKHRRRVWRYLDALAVPPAG